MLRYASMRSMDTTNAIGIHTSIFLQGCNFHCKNCWNESTWDLNGGKELTKDLQNKFIKLSKNDFITGISILGGEPFVQPKEELNNFLKRLKDEVAKPLFLWTGYTFKDIPNKEALHYIDVLIDGRFIEELKDYRLQLRGSSNQKIINVQKTLKKGKIVLWKN